MARLGPENLLSQYRQNLQLPEAAKARIRRTGMPSLTVCVEEAEVSILSAQWEPGRYRLEVLDGSGHPIPGAGKVLEALNEVNPDLEKLRAQVLQELKQELAAEKETHQPSQPEQPPAELARTEHTQLTFGEAPSYQGQPLSLMNPRQLAPSEAVGQAQEIKDLSGAVVELSRIAAGREASVLKWAGDLVKHALDALGSSHEREVLAVEAAGDQAAKRAAVETAAELGQPAESEGAQLIKTVGDVAIALIHRHKGAGGKEDEKPKPPPPPPGL